MRDTPDRSEPTRGTRARDQLIHLSGWLVGLVAVLALIFVLVLGRDDSQPPEVVREVTREVTVVVTQEVVRTVAAPITIAPTRPSTPTNPSATIVGAWRVVSRRGNGPYMTLGSRNVLEFLPDGSCIVSENGSRSAENFRYTFMSGDRVRFQDTTSPVVVIHTVTISGDTMTISDGDDKSASLRRQ